MSLGVTMTWLHSSHLTHFSSSLSSHTFYLASLYLHIFVKKWNKDENVYIKGQFLEWENKNGPENISLVSKAWMDIGKYVTQFKREILGCVLGRTVLLYYSPKYDVHLGPLTWKIVVKVNINKWLSSYWTLKSVKR